MSYTKGKWEAISVPFENNSDYVVLDGKTLCSVKKHFGKEQAQANAHLIAAAPDMYEALEMIYNLALGYTDVPKDEVANAIRPILAKAEGKC